MVKQATAADVESRRAVRERSPLVRGVQAAVTTLLERPVTTAVKFYLVVRSTLSRTNPYAGHSRSRHGMCAA